MPKKYIWNAKYPIQHRIEHSQTTKCIQYNIHDTMSSELLKYFIEKCKYFVLHIIIEFIENWIFSKKLVLLENKFNENFYASQETWGKKVKTWQMAMLFSSLLNQMRKLSPTFSGPKILRRNFSLENASVLNSVFN